MIAQGITEFEGEQGEKETCLNLTLLRCVGWLSRTDLLTRQGNGGWTIETPEGQCLGQHRFDYSLTYHKGSYEDGNVYQVLNKASKPALLWQGETGKELEVGGRLLDFLSHLPGHIRISALKPAEDGKGIILQLFHIGKEDCRFEVKLPQEITGAETVNLAEEAGEELPLKQHKLALDMKAAEIMTIRLKTE